MIHIILSCKTTTNRNSALMVSYWDDETRLHTRKGSVGETSAKNSFKHNL